MYAARVRSQISRSTEREARLAPGGLPGQAVVPVPRGVSSGERGRRVMKWWVLLTAGIGTFMSALNRSVVNAVLPLMRRGLHVDFATIEWVVTIYLLVVSGLLLLFGRLGDLRGHRTWFVYGLADVAGASLRRRVPRCRFGGRTGRRRVCHPARPWRTRAADDPHLSASSRANSAACGS